MGVVLPLQRCATSSIAAEVGGGVVVEEAEAANGGES